jgi:hypothetical protein
VPVGEQPSAPGGAEQGTPEIVAGTIAQPLSQPTAAFAKPSCHVIQSVHRGIHWLSQPSFRSVRLMLIAATPEHRFINTHEHEKISSVGVIARAHDVIG